MKRLAVLFVLVLSTMSCADESLLERAKNLYDVQSYREALALYERAISDDIGQNLPEALDLSGWCLRYLNEWKDAEKRFDEALKVLSGKDASWVYVGRGEVFIETGEYEKAVKNFEEAMKLDPENTELIERCEKGKKIALENSKDTKAKKTPPATERKKPQKPQKPVNASQDATPHKRTSAIVFGVALGVPMSEIHFSQREISRKRDETYYSVVLSKGNVPKFVSDGAKNIHFQLVERKERVHKVIYIVSYTNVADVESKKEQLERELVEFYESNFGILVDFRKGIFHDELRWINSDRHVISASVGNDLAGQIILEVSFIDIDSL